MILHARAKSGSANVSVLEGEIDQLVYSLYGLTREKVAIIEESVEKKTPSREVADESAIEQED